MHNKATKLVRSLTAIVSWHCIDYSVVLQPHAFFFNSPPFQEIVFCLTSLFLLLNITEGYLVWYSTYALIQLQVLNSSKRWSSTGSRWCWFDNRLDRRQGPSGTRPTEKRKLDRKLPLSRIMTYNAFFPDDDPEE